MRGGAARLAAAGLVGGVGVLSLGLWSCPIRQLTGIPCPTCYLTRSVLAVLRGDLAQAVQWHALGPLLVAFGLGVMGWSLAGRSLPSPLLRRGGWVLAWLGLGYWLLRLWGWSHGRPLPG